MTGPDSPFLSAGFGAIAHATEDVEKVEQSMGFLIELIAKTKVSMTRQYLRGHHGNVITTITAKLARKEISPDSLSRLSQRLSESDRQFLADNIPSCIDQDRNLYLRFDKQEAFLEHIRLHEADPIRMKLKFAPAHDADAIVSICMENGLIP
jgi:RNA binding exosome subunit